MAQSESLISLQDEEAVAEDGDAVSVQVSVTTKKKKKKKHRDDDGLSATCDFQTIREEGYEGVPEEVDADGFSKSIALAESQIHSPSRDDRLIAEMTAIKQKMKQLIANQLRVLDLMEARGCEAFNVHAILDSDKTKGAREDIIVGSPYLEKDKDAFADMSVAPALSSGKKAGKKKKAAKNMNATATPDAEAGEGALGLTKSGEDNDAIDDDMHAYHSHKGRKTRLSAIERKEEEASKRELRRALIRAEEMASEEEQRQLLASKNCREMIANMFRSTESLSIALDSVVGFVILLNAVWIGISMDLENAGVGGKLVSMSFSALFMVELFLNLKLHGFWRYEISAIDGHREGSGFFNGKTKYWNWFDAFLVCIDISQIVVSFLPSDSEDAEGGSTIASAFRLIRLAKLLRLLRLLRAEVFSDLFVMVEGMVGGMTTLVWALVLLLAMLYVLSLACRELYGRDTSLESYALYNTVPRSFLTTFQCAFDVGCATKEGFSIPEIINKEYGWHFGVFNLLVMFVITIGVLNVVSAIFVENTLTYAHAIVSDKKQKRLQDKDLWARSVATLVLELLIRVNGLAQIDGRHSCIHKRLLEEELSSKIEDIAAVVVKRKVLDEWVKDEDVRDALEALDINPHCFEFLSDILDHDNRDSITMHEILDGIRRLRGDPRRSDIIAIDLMVRHVHALVVEVNRKLDESQVINKAPTKKQLTRSITYTPYESAFKAAGDQEETLESL